MGNFQPLSKERAEEIRRIMTRSRAGGEGLAFDADGQCQGTSPVSSSPDDRRNVIGKFNQHFAC